MSTASQVRASCVVTGREGSLSDPMNTITPEMQPDMVPVLNDPVLYRVRSRFVLDVDGVPFGLDEHIPYIIEAGYQLDGMSIPCHDHFHLHSAALPSSRFFCQLIEDEHSKSGPPERFPQATPFATLFLIDSDRAALAQRAAEVIGRLEFGHIVYTAAYWQGGFALSPRTCDVSVDRIPKVGGDVPMHSFDPEEPGVLEHIQRHVLRRGQFDWRPFIKH